MIHHCSKVSEGSKNGFKTIKIIHNVLVFLTDLRNSLSAVIKNDKVVYNSAATMFFFLGFNVICNVQFSIGKVFG